MDLNEKKISKPEANITINFLKGLSKIYYDDLFIPGNKSLADWLDRAFDKEIDIELLTLAAEYRLCLRLCNYEYYDLGIKVAQAMYQKQVINYSDLFGVKATYIYYAYCSDMEDIGDLLSNLIRECQQEDVGLYQTIIDTYPCLKRTILQEQVFSTGDFNGPSHDDFVLAIEWFMGLQNRC